MVIIFRDYFATERQKERLKNILINNSREYQENLKEKYSTNIKFNNGNKEEQESEKKDVKEDRIKDENLSMIKYKQNLFIRLIRKIKKFLNL